MKVVLSSEASEKISSAKPPTLENGVAAILYSYRPHVEEHYHRSSEAVTVSFSGSENLAENERWVLGWYKREKVSEESIIQVGDIELIFTPVNCELNSTEAYIHFKDNKFHVTYR